MTGLAPDADAALEPIRRALRAEAARRTDELRESSARDSAAILSAASERAQAISAAATEAGEAAGRETAAARSAHARRSARSLVLAAQRDVAQQWAQGAREQAAKLRDDPGYPEMLTRLTARALNALGPDATVRQDPQGGITAESGSRRLDLTLEALADAAVARLQQSGAAPWLE